MKNKILAPAALALILSACSGNEPLSMIGDPSAVGTIRMPGDLTTTLTGTFTAYTASQDGFGFQAQANPSSITAPASGLVIAADATGIVLFHNSRLTTRVALVSGTFTPGVFVNQYVSFGTTIATVTQFTTLRFSTYVDGTAACPFNVLLPSDKSTVFARFVGANPCQN